jgi:hypothetical protein
VDAVTGERRFIVPGAGPVETLELDPAEGGLGSTVSSLTLASFRCTGAPAGGRAGPGGGPESARPQSLARRATDA